ncbi:MAG TPA: LuxR C-terminal-related transcriptional regulator [Euzebyales bacterium]|nr:LuxR C-terminal-related transcriptional regulator [Euzebyales bacterium]
MLAIKLLVPRSPRHVVLRPHLFGLLDGGVRGPVTIVAAQPGAGKTVLLSSWITAVDRPEPVAWLTLDAGDNDPEKFWRHLLAAVWTAARPASFAHGSDDDPRLASSDALLTHLIGVLDDLPAPVVLVLDDFHVITETSVLDGMGTLLRYAPRQLRLIISTRADPVLPLLPRLRVSGGMTEVRAADLAFSVEDAATLFAWHDVTLSDEHLAIVHSRTEGWAAGLRLAAMSLQARADRADAVATFAGTDRAISDYLAAEVLDQQPPHIRSFLLRTSVVRRLNADLANALTGRNDGQQTLAELERDNGFVVPLGSDRIWYRYQHLFAEVLGYELRREAPAEIGPLHMRAAAWYADHEFPVEAARHALEAREWTEGADLIVDHGLDMAMSGKTATIRELVEQLPEDIVRDSPQLTALLAFDSLDLLDVEQANAFLHQVRQQHDVVSVDRRHEFALLLAYLRLTIAERFGDLEGIRAAGGELLAAQASSGVHVVGRIRDRELRAVALADLALAELWTGHLATVDTRLREAQLRAEQARLHGVRLQSLSHLSLLQAGRGELRAAARTAGAALGQASELGLVERHETAGARLALAFVNLEWNDLTNAARHLSTARAASDASPWQPLRFSVALLHAWLCLAEGDPERGLAVLEAGRLEDTALPPPPWLQRWADLTAAQLRVAAGDLVTARSAVQRLEVGAVTGVPWSAPVALAVADLELAHGDPTTALDAVLPLVDGSAHALPGPLISAQLLVARAARAVGDAQLESRSVEQALALAEGERFGQRFAAPGIRPLLASHFERMTAYRPFIAQLLDAGSTAHAPREVAALHVFEPLSERERIVLRYLPSRLSAGEIASELYVSVHTVKTHMRHIYRKLRATSRREAVDRARTLDLL